MFTGIVGGRGRVAESRPGRLGIQHQPTAETAAIGASVAVNGVCLTAVAIGSGRLTFDLGPETLSRTALADLGPGDSVNLERPMRLDGFLGGHLVLGHVDGVGSVVALDRAGETARLRIEWQGQDLAPLLIPQGSVAVDGVSLTVAALEVGAFEIMLIPHTLERTTLGTLKPGRRVNLEMDVIGKYVLRVLSVRGEPR